jgi:hypothetical protein
MMGEPFSKARRLALAAERNIIVDAQDQWLLEEFTWTINDDGYPHTRLSVDIDRRRPRVFLHHMIIGYPIWEGDEIDHINRCVTNNSRDNLRYVNKSQSMVNRSWQVGETGERNITLRNTGMYKVTVWRDKGWIYLGQFHTLAEAITARDKYLQVVSTDTI